MDARGLADQLRPLLGDDAIITDHQRLRTYECDGLAQYKVTPALVVLAETTAHVAAVVRACAAAGLPFVARGSGTGLSGGALPHADGVPIVMSRMREVLEIDRANQRAVVEPGVINLQLTRAAQPQGYYYAPDPSSQQICSIGGNVAENSGGAHWRSGPPGPRSTAATRAARAQCSSSSSTVRTQRWPTSSTRWWCSVATTARSRSASRLMTLSGRCSGRGASPPSPPSGGSVLTTSSRTASSRGQRFRWYCDASLRSRTKLACALPTFSTPATATCTRWCCSTPRCRASPTVPNKSPARSWICASSTAARSPASTVSAPTRPSTCRGCSAMTTLTRCSWCAVLLTHRRSQTRERSSPPHACAVRSLAGTRAPIHWPTPASRKSSDGRCHPERARCRNGRARRRRHSGGCRGRYADPLGGAA